MTKRRMLFILLLMLAAAAAPAVGLDWVAGWRSAEARLSQPDHAVAPTSARAADAIGRAGAVWRIAAVGTPAAIRP